MGSKPTSALRLTVFSFTSLRSNLFFRTRVAFSCASIAECEVEMFFSSDLISDLASTIHLQIETGKKAEGVDRGDGARS